MPQSVIKEDILYLLNHRYISGKEINAMDLRQLSRMEVELRQRFSEINLLHKRRPKVLINLLSDIESLKALIKE